MPLLFPLPFYKKGQALGLVMVQLAAFMEKVGLKTLVDISDHSGNIAFSHSRILVWEFLLRDEPNKILSQWLPLWP